MWNLPGPGIEPTSAALAGEFLTSGPPEKSWETSLKELTMRRRQKLLTAQRERRAEINCWRKSAAAWATDQLGQQSRRQQPQLVLELRDTSHSSNYI